MTLEKIPRERIIPILIGIMILAAGIRGLYFAKQWSVWWDETVYLSMADAFAGNNYFFEYFRPPLLPFMLYIFGTFAGITIVAGKVFSLLVSMATVAVSYLLVRKILDREKALIVAFLFAINSYSIFYSTRILSESLTVLLNLLALGFLYLSYERNSLKYAALTGIFIALGAMTKHLSAYFVFAAVAYLYLTTGMGFLRDKKIYVIGLLTLLVMSPWLVFDWLQFGNPFWAQLQNIGMSPPEGILFYPLVLPIFVGIQGIFALFALNLKKMKTDKFLLLNWVTVITGLVVMSLVSHKEDRFLMVILPSIIILESIGLYNFVNILDKKIRKNAMVFIAAVLSIFTFVLFIQMPNQYEDLMYKCNDVIKTLPNEAMSTTMSPYFSYFNKRFFDQLPWEANEFSCENLLSRGYNYTIYYSSGWYEPRESAFLDATSSCTELLYNITQNQKCLIFRIKR